MISRRAGPARIALVGAGLVGRKHAARFAKEASLVAIVDPDDSAEEVAARYHAVRHATIADLLTGESVDGVVVATPNELHFEHGMACIRAGVPVLIEKPLAVTLVDGRSLAIAAEAASVPVLVGHHRRHNPLIVRAKSAIDDGVLGEIVSVEALCWLGKPDAYFDVAWRIALGGGPLAINLVHDIDLMVHLCGGIEAVQAIASNHTRGFAVEDTAAVIVRFESGAIGTMTVSDTITAPWSWELTSAENPDFAVHGESCYRIGGTTASISIPDLRIWHQDGARDWLKPVRESSLDVERDDPLRLQARHFATIAVGNAKPRVTAWDGVRVLEIIEAIRRSAASGAMVRIADVA